MKRSLIFTLLILLCASYASAQTRFQKKRIERLAVQIAEAYKAKNLSSLDRARLIRGSVKIVVDYVEETPETVMRFRSFKALEQWLDRRVAKGLDNPGRFVRQFAGCRRGSCTFDDDGGSLHNQLYLFEVLYGYRKGRLYIKALHLWNGD